MSKAHVAVLMGGWSSERPVSLSSGNACADGLERAGYRVSRIDVSRDRYPNLIRMPEPVIDVVFAGLYLRPDVGVETAADFARYRFGYVRGWRVAERLFADLPDAVVVREAGQLLEMLDAGRLDVVFLTVAPARRLALDRGMPRPRVTGFTVSRPLYLHLHERNAALIRPLTDALRSMKEDGRYRRIMSGYELENR